MRPMRTMTTVFALVAGLALPAAAQDAGKKSAVLKVSGMSCGACANTVEKEAKKIDGVVAAKVSQPKGQAEITYDPAKTSPEAIAKKLTEKSGYKAEAPKAPTQ